MHMFRSIIFTSLTSNAILVYFLTLLKDFQDILQLGEEHAFIFALAGMLNMHEIK